MKTYICRNCGHTIAVGHPVGHFKRRSLAIARSTYSLITRIFRHGNMRRQLQTALEEKYYLQPDCFRTLPRACPRCAAPSVGDRDWWRPGLIFRG